MRDYLPILTMIVLVVLFVSLSFIASTLLAPKRPDVGEGGAVRVRDRARVRARRALPGEVLSGRDGVHRARRRDRLPVSVHHGLPRARPSTGSIAMGIFLLVLLVPFAYLLSTGALEWGPVKQVVTRTGATDPACRRHARARRPRPDAVAASDEHREGGLMGLESVPHNFLTGRVEDVVHWGRRNSVWPATFGLACCAIEMMATGAAHYDLVALRHGDLPRQPAPGRPHDRRRPRQPEDGAGAAPGLRPDGRAEVGHLDGRVREQRRACSTTTRSCRASTRSFPSTCTCRAARPGPRR